MMPVTTPFTTNVESSAAALYSAQELSLNAGIVCGKETVSVFPTLSERVAVSVYETSTGLFSFTSTVTMCLSPGTKETEDASTSLDHSTL